MGRSAHTLVWRPQFGAKPGAGKLLWFRSEGRMKTKSGVSLGISLPYSFPDARVDHAYIRRCARQAEALGFDDGWLTEGILNPNFVLEPVTYIANLAATTEKIRFGISVIILNHRNPIQLAKEL